MTKPKLATTHKQKRRAEPRKRVKRLVLLGKLKRVESLWGNDPSGLSGPGKQKRK